MLDIEQEVFVDGNLGARWRLRAGALALASLGQGLERFLDVDGIRC